MKNLHLFSPGVKHTESYFARVPVPITELAHAHTHTHTHTHTHKHTLAPNTNTQTHKGLKQSYGITKVTCVLVGESLTTLVLGNLRALRDSLAKTSIILSSVPPQSIIPAVPALFVDSTVGFFLFFLWHLLTVKGQ